MDTKSIEFGRWLEQADREELIDFIQKNAGSFDVNTVLGIDDRGLRPVCKPFSARVLQGSKPLV